MEIRNVYLYWIGNEYKLISILRKLIYLHSTNGKGYKVILITDKNINNYIKNIPTYFTNLCPAHQADFVRVNVICDYGGIWLDSDTIVLDSLDSLFNIIENKNGFFIKQNNDILWNGIFGSKPNTSIMIKWKTEMINKLENTQGQIKWCDIGNIMLQNFYNKNSKLYDDYTIFNGLDNLYPVNWNNCVNEFIDKPYDNYKNIIREYQPLVILVNTVYIKVETMTEQEILEGTMPINYFINKSVENNNNEKKIGNVTCNKIINIKSFLDSIPIQTNIISENICEKQLSIPGSLIIDTYIVNLKKHLDRKHHLEKNIETTNVTNYLNIKFIDGVDGNNISAETTLFKICPVWFDPILKTSIRLGEIGCALSHYKCWLEFYNSGKDHAIFLEDDIYFINDKFKENVDIFLKYPQDADIVYIKRNSLNKSNETNYNDNFINIKTSYWTCGYLLTRKGVEKIMKTTYLDNLITVDEFLPILYDRSYLPEYYKYYNIELKGYALNDSLCFINLNENTFGASSTFFSKYYKFNSMFTSVTSNINCSISSINRWKESL